MAKTISNREGCHLELAYTNSDDGVYLYCTCGWETNLGFAASPYDAIRCANEHLLHQTLDGEEIAQWLTDRDPTLAASFRERFLVRGRS